MNCQSINKAMLNTIRPDALASLRRVSEAQNRTPTRQGQGNFGDLSSGETVSAGEGMHGVGGDRMAGSWSDMNQGSLFGKGMAFMTDKRSEEPCPKGDRAFVRAKKWGNARGAKGGRKVETLNKRTKETAPSMSYGLSTVKSNPSTRTFNSCPVSVGRLGNESLPLIEPERSTDASADLLWS